MDISLYALPTMQNGVAAVEFKYCELFNKYRNGETLDPVVLDWMDTANTWLITSESRK